MSAVINFGSVNIDYIYRVPHLVKPGETLSSKDFSVVLGGKGANQSVALARAGVEVAHIGRVSNSDSWVVERLQELGVDTRHFEVIDEASGHAIIQVDDGGENAIVLHGGANQSFELDRVCAQLQAEKDNYAYLLMQNECNLLDQVIHTAADSGYQVVLNPAPMTAAVQSLAFDQIAILIVNQIEAAVLTGEDELQRIVEILLSLSPATKIVLTLGAEGAMLLFQGRVLRAESPKVEAVDTTGAGDTFVGYFVAGIADGMAEQTALERACIAASIAVTRAGATPSIPLAAELAALPN